MSINPSVGGVTLKKIRISFLFLLVLGTVILYSNRSDLSAMHTVLNGSEDLEQFLKNPDQDFTDWTAGYDIYLSEDAHYTQMSYDQQKYLAEYFVKNHQVRNILLEISYSEGAYITNYLETGNRQQLLTQSERLKYLPEESKIAYLNLLDFYDELNKSLPTGESLRVIGIDIEYHEETKLQFIKSLLPDASAPIPPNIAQQVNLLRSELSNSMKKSKDYYTKLGQELANDISLHHKDYRAYFGEDYLDFIISIRNLASNAYDRPQREQTIAENLKNCYEELPGQKFYGQYGGWHLQKNMVRYPRTEKLMLTFVGDLSENYPPLKDKILVINQYLTNVQHRYPEMEGVGRLKNSYCGDFGYLFLPVKYLKIGNIKQNPQLYEALLKLGFPPSITLSDYVIIGNRSAPA